MTGIPKALDDLVSAMESRTRGLTGRQFENMISPRIADAFVRSWVALGRNPHDIPGEWQELAETFSDIG